MNCGFFFFFFLNGGWTSFWCMTVLFVGDYSTLVCSERIKKLTVCCSIQGLFIMYLLLLFKPLMQEVLSHMTGRERACVCLVWRNGDPCARCVQTKVSTATTCTISPLIKTQGWSASITPYSHAHTHTCTMLTLASARPSQPLIEDHFVQMVPLYVEGCYAVVLVGGGGLISKAVWLRRDSQRWSKNGWFISDVHTTVHL